jgi:flagellar biosynthetic protein FliO
MIFSLLEVAAMPTVPATHSSAIDFSLLFIKMIAALVVACVLAVLILKFAVPKFSLFKAGPKPNDKIKILSRTPLGPKQQLYLVKVVEKCILVGVTDQNITKLADVEGKIEE